MTISTTQKYLLPYPDDTEPVRNLPDIIKSQAEAIDSILSGFDYDGGDASALTSRIVSLETRMQAMSDNVVVLFDNDANVFQGGITLSETAANFEKLTFCFKTNDTIYGSMDVANPDQKLIALTSTMYMQPEYFWLKSRTYKINGKNVNTYLPSTGQDYRSGEVNASGSHAAKMTDTITITQVYGTRKMALQ